MQDNEIIKIQIRSALYELGDRVNAMNDEELNEFLRSQVLGRNLMIDRFEKLPKKRSEFNIVSLELKILTRCL